MRPNLYSEVITEAPEENTVQVKKKILKLLLGISKIFLSRLQSDWGMLNKNWFSRLTPINCRTTRLRREALQSGISASCQGTSSKRQQKTI